MCNRHCWRCRKSSRLGIALFLRFRTCCQWCSVIRYPDRSLPGNRSIRKLTSSQDMNMPAGLADKLSPIYDARPCRPDTHIVKTQTRGVVQGTTKRTCRSAYYGRRESQGPEVHWRTSATTSTAKFITAPGGLGDCINKELVAASHKISDACRLRSAICIARAGCAGYCPASVVTSGISREVHAGPAAVQPVGAIVKPIRGRLIRAD